MKRIFTSIMLWCVCSMLHAQPGNIDPIGYSRGTIRLNDGRILTGFVNYNTEEGALFYRSKSESGVYTPRSVQYFSLFDENRVRRFYSLEHVDEDDGRKSSYFFEVIEELPNFVVLIRVDQIEVKSNGYYMTLANTIGLPTSSFNSPYKPVQYRKQDETIYLMNSKGELQPYLTTKYIYKYNRIYLKSRVVHKELLSKYFGTSFPKIEKFTKENRLAFDNRNDFLKMVAYYKEIVKINQF